MINFKNASYRFVYLDRNRFNIDFHRTELALEAGGDMAVGDDRVDLVRHGDEGEGPLVHLGGVEYGNHFTGPGDHDLVGAGLLHAGGSSKGTKTL